DEDAKCILVHLKGQPSRSTRRLLKRLNEELKLPCATFTDGDPWSFRIHASVAYGAIKTAHISEYLATPTTEFVGITASDILNYELPTDALTPRDVGALNAEMSDPRFNDEFGLRSRRLRAEGRPHDLLGLRRSDLRDRNRIVDRLGGHVLEDGLRHDWLESHRILPGDLFKREATVDRVAELSRHRVHVELADGPPFRSAARRDLRLDAPERQVIEILPDDALVRDHEHPSAEPVARALRRLHEREAEGESGESLRRSAAWIEADRRVPVHVSAIDAFDAEQSVLRE